MNEDRKSPIIFIIFGAVILVGALIFVLLYKKAFSSLEPKGVKLQVDWNDSSKPDYSNISLEFDYEEEGSDIVYDKTAPYASVTVDIAYDDESYSTSTHTLSYMTEDDRYVATLDESNAWDYISNGMYKDYPSGSYASHESELKSLQQSNLTYVPVRVWTWAEPGNQDNLDKVTEETTFAVNSKVADSFEHIMQDIYNDPSQPVINLADKGMGTWVLRGKNHNPNRSMSAHALGCCIDINPGTGSFFINDALWAGNGYGQQVMSSQIWEQLPACQRKYNVLYDGCPIVETFKAYGWYWGGDWNSTKDPMHLGYIGDGTTARSVAISNYENSTLN